MKNLENKNAENNSDVLKWYFENEKNLTILAKGKKNPIVKNWLDKLIPYSTITQYHNDGYNIGFVLSDTDLVVDCDPRNYKDNVDSLELLQNDLGVRLQDHAPTVRTGGGGFHFYFSKPSDLNINEVLDKYPGIEFKTEGRQVCAAGSLHPSGNYYKWLRNDIEQKELAPLLKLLKRANVPHHNSGSEKIRNDQLAELLQLLPPEQFCSNDLWFPIMCAAHDATDGNGIEEFIQWSTSDPNYANAENEIRTRWNSLSDKAEKYTLGTILMHLQKSGQNYHNILNSHDFDDLPPLDNSDDDIFDDEPENISHSAADEEITADNFDELVFGISGSDDTDSDTSDSSNTDSDTSDSSNSDSDSGTDDIDEILEQKFKQPDSAQVLTLAKKLTEYSSNDDISNAIRATIHADPITNARALKIIANNTDLSQTQIKAIQADLLKSDIGDLAHFLAELTLRRKYDNGKNLIMNYNGQFWYYNGKYWQTVIKEYVGKHITEQLLKLREKMSIKQSENELVSNAVSIIGKLTAQKDDQLGLADEPKPVINCLNGELWLNSKGEYKFRKHKASSHLVNLNKVKFDPKAECPVYEKALKETFKNLPDCDDVIRHFYEVIGYILHPEKTPAKWFLLRGNGSDGKTTQMKIISALLGSAVLPESIERFSTGSFADSHATSSLVGKLLVYDDDLNKNIVLPDGTLKKLSEDGQITANPKGYQPFTFTKVCTVVMCCNGTPKTKDISKGFRRRAMVIPFDRGFTKEEQDPTILKYIIKNELSGVLNKALEGLKRLKQRGYFQEPISCKEAKNSWLDSANSTAGFIRDCVEITKQYTTDKVSLNDLYMAYCNYCEEQNYLHVTAKNSFKESCMELGLAVKSRGRHHSFVGIKLKAVTSDFDFDTVADADDTDNINDDEL